jgi:small subunit ribosomal protein S7
MRKAKPKKRVILPDPVFNDQKVSKFVNHLMYDGKKNVSYKFSTTHLDGERTRCQTRRSLLSRYGSKLSTTSLRRWR